MIRKLFMLGSVDHGAGSGGVDMPDHIKGKLILLVLRDGNCLSVCKLSPKRKSSTQITRNSRMYLVMLSIVTRHTQGLRMDMPELEYLTMMLFGIGPGGV